LSSFEPFAAFTRLDRNANGKIADLELYQFLRDNDVNYVTLRDCQIVCKYFDLDNDGGLNYQEFMQLMLPCDDMILRSAATQRKTYSVGRYERLPALVERELTVLLEKEIAYHTKVERQKVDLSLRYDWTNRAAFETVDTTRDYVLNHRNIQSFLRINGFYATDSEIVAIIRRLDIDAD
jgi:Ca2+-binding EF-hand superfamily protein